MESLYFGQNVRDRVRRRAGARRRARRRRRERRPVLRLHAAAGQGRRLRQRARGQGPGDAMVQALLSLRPSRSPTTPRTRWPSRSATSTTRRCATPRRTRWPERADDRAGRRRGRGPPRRPRRARDLGRRRIPARRLGGDAASRSRRSAAASRCTPTSSSATTRSRCTASRPRRSATSSSCCSACRASARRSRSASSAAGLRASSSRALAAGDVARLQAVPGVGKRTAERIVVELREKVVPDGADEPAFVVTRGDDPRRIARDGLLELGFPPSEADRCSAGPRARAPRSSSRAPCGAARR